LPIDVSDVDQRNPTNKQTIFGSSPGFSVSVDRMALFAVR